MWLYEDGVIRIVANSNLIVVQCVLRGFTKSAAEMHTCEMRTHTEGYL